jgi:hypothetical protein
MNTFLPSRSLVFTTNLRSITQTLQQSNYKDVKGACCGFPGQSQVASFGESAFLSAAQEPLLLAHSTFFNSSKSCWGRPTDGAVAALCVAQVCLRGVLLLLPTLAQA